MLSWFLDVVYVEQLSVALALQRHGEKFQPIQFIIVFSIVALVRHKSMGTVFNLTKQVTVNNSEMDTVLS